MAAASILVGEAALAFSASRGGGGGVEVGETANAGAWRKGGYGLVVRRCATAQAWKKSAVAVGSEAAAVTANCDLESHREKRRERKKLKT